MKRIESWVRSPLGRALVAGLGLALVGAVLAHAGPARVWSSVRRGARVLPVLFALDGVYNALELLALRRLYGDERGRVPLPALLRAGLVAYALGGVMPLGRPIVESVRGVALARYVSGPRAAAAGARLQLLLLLSQSLLCVPCALAVVALRAPAALLAALLADALLTGGMGVALYVATRREALAARLARASVRGREFAPAFLRHVRDEPLPGAAVALVLAGRGVQVVQYVTLLAAFRGGAGWLRGLGAVGFQMVGATLGDFLPTHVGGTEAMAPLGARTLSVSLSDALAIPLIMHAEQAAWIALGFVAYALWPAGSAPGAAARRGAARW